MMVGLKRISTVIGLLAVTASAAFGQGTVANPNQMTADSVASALRVSRALSGSRIEIEAQGGLVTLTGQLATPALKAEAVARARNVAGVRG
ncbi:MAG: BON domain-containing protein, partial [Isosphaeraceae bacterium]